MTHFAWVIIYDSRPDLEWPWCPRLDFQKPRPWSQEPSKASSFPTSKMNWKISNCPSQGYSIENFQNYFQYSFLLQENYYRKIFVCLTLVFASIAETVRKENSLLWDPVYPAWSFPNPRQLFFWATNQIRYYPSSKIQKFEHCLSVSIFITPVLYAYPVQYTLNVIKNNICRIKRIEIWFRKWVFLTPGLRDGPVRCD